MASLLIELNAEQQSNWSRAGEEPVSNAVCKRAARVSAALDNLMPNWCGRSSARTCWVASF
eukprot:9233360-Prorocentrum_lima.AAC.1